MRERKAPTKNQLAQQVRGKTEDLDKRVESLEMATRMSQMLTQQVGNSISQLAADLREIASRQRDIQYRLLAIQEIDVNLGTEAVNALAEKKQVADFTSASVKENKELGYTPGEVINEDSVVIFTTKTSTEGKSILRSKLALADIALPEFRDSLLKRKAGESFDADLQGVSHEVTVLEVFQKPIQEKIDEQKQEQA